MVDLSKNPLAKKRIAFPHVKNFVIGFLESDKPLVSISDPAGPNPVRRGINDL